MKLLFWFRATASTYLNELSGIDGWKNSYHILITLKQKQLIASNQRD